MQVGNLKKIHIKGFTLVELLVVIVVLGILASISIVAYNGTQGRARDSRRQNDISELAKGLELYYLDNHKYPTSGGATVTTNTWNTTADASWSTFVTALKPYMDNNVPSDPTSTPNANIMTPNGYNYAYFSNSSPTVTCGAGTNQMYILVYRLESSSQVITNNGNCATTVPTFSGQVSVYRMTRI
jgi:general secretion pathway protein G